MASSSMLARVAGTTHGLLEPLITGHQASCLLLGHAARHECIQHCFNRDASWSMTSAQHFSSSQVNASEPQSKQQDGALQPVQHHEVDDTTIEQIRARIFGEPIRTGERTGRQVLAQPLRGSQLARWYFMLPNMPGMHNEEREYINMRKLNERQKKASEAEDSGGKKKKK